MGEISLGRINEILLHPVFAPHVIPSKKTFQNDSKDTLTHVPEIPGNNNLVCNICPEEIWDITT